MVLLALGAFLTVDAAVKKASSQGASTKTTRPAPKKTAPVKQPPPPPPDTTLFGRPIADSATVGVRIYEYIAYPTLQLVTWPVQNILAPGVELLTYPSQEPIRYFLEENVIDRSLELFSAGKNDHIRLYPTISLASGTSSRVGAVLRDQAVFGRDRERLVSYLNYFVNGDYRFRAYLTAKELGGTNFAGKVAFSLNRVKNTPVYEPDVNRQYFYRNSSESYEAQLDHPLWLGFSARGGYALTSIRNGESPANTGVLTSDFFADENGVISDSSRGLRASFIDQTYKAGLLRDTRNNPNIPVDGSLTELGVNYHEVGGNQDFVEWRARYLKFFKLGGERYEITADEEKKSGGLNMDEFIRKLEYQRLRQQFFSRKVVAFQLFAARSYELPGNRMPVQGLQALGNGTPLRAYPGSRFRNYGVVAGTMEYRFPILRIMDGTLFNEYGMFGKALDEPDMDNLRNSWGFGVRVRRPDMFLFRVELAFHGFSGMAINATADAPF
ncbi:MAG: hypothetical protein K0Q91_775 [Fibrobacteria bacterium]|jgi:hypothetical protein|nr:hypothetical protein [Fibrobacteria bacterium]